MRSLIVLASIVLSTLFLAATERESPRSGRDVVFEYERGMMRVNEDTGELRIRVASPTNGAGVIYILDRREFERKIGPVGDVKGKRSLAVRIIRVLPARAADNQGRVRPARYRCEILRDATGETTLEIRPKYLEFRDDDTVVYAPDSDVQRASYTRYVFNRGDFERKVGRLAGTDEPVNVLIKIRSTVKVRREVAAGMPAPAGGFFDIVRKCRIISRAGQDS